MAAHRVNELHGIIAIDLAPESGNVYFNYVTEFLPVVVVEMLQQLALGNHRTGPVRKVFQDAVFHGHERYLLLPAFHSAFNCIQLQVGHLEHRRPLALSAPYQSLGSRQKFAQIKGLGNVIVSTLIEQAHHILFLVPGGQH